MVIYFDESYNDKYLIYGALFNPHSSFLHQGLTKIKTKHGFVNPSGVLQELKYNTTVTPKHLKANKEIIDLFMSSTSWFRCIVIDTNGFDYNFFGTPSEPLKMKKARAYKKFAEMLLDKNTGTVRNSVLLCDQLTRCKGDEFMSKLKEKYTLNRQTPVFKDIFEIDSSLEQYQVNQVNDLLMGCVYNELNAVQNKHKKALKDHLVTSLDCSSLLQKDWENKTKSMLDETSPKYQIWYWQKKPKKS